MSTFSAQHRLPSLPVPKLSDTLDRYLESASANATEEQYSQLKQVVDRFRASPLTEKLQSKLETRSKQQRNWLEEWWIESYMTIREPLIPYISIGSKVEYLVPREGSQLYRAADVLHQWMSFWQIIRKEQLPIFIRQNEPWDMIQYYHLFSSNRTPAPNTDVLNRYFRTEKEGQAPEFLIVLYNGNIWKVEGTDSNGQPKTPDEFYHILSYIKKNSAKIEKSVISLTSLPRDEWAQVHENLGKISAQNKDNLKLIEQGIFCLTLVDEVETDWKALNRKAMLNNSNQQWTDKSLGLTIFGDGQCTMVIEHSNMDAIAVIHADSLCNTKVRNEIWTPKDVSFEKPDRLLFDLSTDILGHINIADKKFEEIKNLTNNDVVEYRGFGADFLKKNRLFPDTVIQIALQLAFAKLHNKFAPIYETASTRKFYHGRTETVRGRSKEIVRFAQAVLQKTSKKSLKDLFMDAYRKHNELMANAMNGEGVDRHLFGLRKILATEFPKEAIPEIYTHPSWKQNGGDGNFLLSTSFVGYVKDSSVSNFGRICSPMTANGYGVFYNIAPNKFILNISDYKNTQSNLEGFKNSIEWALNTIWDLLQQSSL